MVMSVHTNKSAMIALHNLNKTGAELETAQNRINTGLKVGGAKDNAAVYAVAQNMRADTGALNAVGTSLDRAISIADVALAAGESISDLLVQMREKATAALDPSIDTFTRNAYDADFKALRDQLRVILDGTISPGIEFLADADASRSLTLKTQNLSLSGANITLTTTIDLSTVTNSQDTLSQIKASLDNVNQALANLGSDLKKLEAHNSFVSKLQAALTVGIGNLVDADLATESAKLQALQVKQQLGVQALSIANSQPQIILNLFGGG